MDLLEELKKWAKLGNRGVNITINDNECRIWIYDCDLMVGQFINDISEINLEKIKEDEDRKQYEILKNKFK